MMEVDLYAEWLESAQREADRISEEGTARRCIPRQNTDTDALLADGVVLMRSAMATIDALEAEIGALREAILNLGGDPDQAWFWTDRWQQLEREAQEDIDAGRVEDASDFLAE